MTRVVVTARGFGAGRSDPIGALRAAGLEVVEGDLEHDLEALRAPLASAEGWIAGTWPVTAAHLDLAPRLRVLARHGTGTDAVDVAAATARGVVVTNTPGANAEAVADHALALMLAALRHVVAADAGVRNGDWATRRGRELGELTVGVVGFGRVGRGVVRRAAAGFGARVLAHDPYIDEVMIRAGGAEPVPLLALAEHADVVSLHLPGGGRPVVDAALLARMKPDAVLVNTARGSLVDEPAVAAALTAGRLGAAAVDVLAEEPPRSSPLLSAPRVIVTPHIAAQTSGAADRMGMESVREVIRVLGGEPPLHPVTQR